MFSIPTEFTTAPAVREQLAAVLREHYRQPARDICNALLDFAAKRDDQLRANGDEALIDDKTVFIVKRAS